MVPPPGRGTTGSATEPDSLMARASIRSRAAWVAGGLRSGMTGALTVSVRGKRVGAEVSPAVSWLSASSADSEFPARSTARARNLYVWP
jgi:hypothetical protein